MYYNNSKTLRFHTDNKFYDAAGEEYTGSICDVSNITWEHYFIHIDFLKNNPHLKKYILNSEDITKTFV
jgi:hypothetical protein